MEQLVLSLKQSRLFKNLDNGEIKAILVNSNHIMKTYKKGELIAIEADLLNSIGVIVSGKIVTQKIYPDGKILSLVKMGPGSVFGEVAIFSTSKIYPATIMAEIETQIIFFHKTTVLQLCRSNTIILENLVTLLSNKILMLNQKVTLLAQKSIRQKIASFLYDEYLEQNTMSIKLKMTKKSLAEQFDVTRPSLSRELIHMKEDGLIEYDRNTILIKNILEIEKLLT